MCKKPYTLLCFVLLLFTSCADSPFSGFPETTATNYFSVAVFDDNSREYNVINLDNHLENIWIRGLVALKAINNEHIALNHYGEIIIISLTDLSVIANQKIDYGPKFYLNGLNYWSEGHVEAAPIRWNSALSDSIIVRNSLISYTPSLTEKIQVDTLAIFNSLREKENRWATFEIDGYQENLVHVKKSIFELVKDSLEQKIRLNHFYTDYQTYKIQKDKSPILETDYNIDYDLMGTNSFEIKGVLNNTYLIFGDDYSLFSMNIRTNYISTISTNLPNSYRANTLIHNNKFYYTKKYEIFEYDPASNHNMIIHSDSIHNFEDLVLSIPENSNKLFINYIGQIRATAINDTRILLWEYDISTQIKRKIFEEENFGNGLVVANVINQNGKYYALVYRYKDHF